MEVLSFIAEYIDMHGFSPTIREIAEQFHVSIKAAHDRVSALKKKGCLRTGGRSSRTMEILLNMDSANGTDEARSYADDLVAVPLLGVVAAGRPIMAEENWEGSIWMHRSLLEGGLRFDKRGRETLSNYFALKVKGDSMIGAGIMDGDTAIVERREEVRNGEIAVVQTEDRVTLKRFFREADQVRLQPENPQYEPMFCTTGIRILGRLATIIRSY
jgi:repressor LexA